MQTTIAETDALDSRKAPVSRQGPFQLAHVAPPRPAGAVSTAARNTGSQGRSPRKRNRLTARIARTTATARITAAIGLPEAIATSVDPAIVMACPEFAGLELAGRELFVSTGGPFLESFATACARGVTLSLHPEVIYEVPQNDFFYRSI
ncbi:hypothetical protein A0W34_32370 (plasmid) [Rhodococcus sp. BH4]|nr:hypothetical protein A0W34_32370 [Rhodococcus sp. BH4]